MDTGKITLESNRARWIGGAVFLGVIYASVGILFAGPVGSEKAWRLAAWVVSAFAFAAHIGYERFRLRNSPVSAALHVALGAAIGALGLAVSANVHALRAGTPSEHRTLLLLSLALWPAITALPAFAVALATSWILARASRSL